TCIKFCCFFFQAEDGIRDKLVTGVQTCALPICVIDTVLESNTQLIANAGALKDEWKRTKLSNIALLLKAAIEAQGRVGIMLNVRSEERRVGKECRSRGSLESSKKRTDTDVVAEA